MPIRDATPVGEPCWADLWTRDLPRSERFYCELFGWTARSSGEEYGGYVTFMKDGRDVAGMTAQMPDVTGPDAWCTYLAVTDVDETAQVARTAGAQVIAEPMTVGELGRMAILEDPSGAMIGLWQPLGFVGFRVVDEPGAPVWHELVTRAWTPAVTFYENVFGWEPVPLSDTAEFRYSTIGQLGEMVAGLYDAENTLPEGVPSHWQVYLGVADVTDAAARVVELGGTVLREPWDSDFGSFAQVADPTGAMFLLGGVPAVTSAERADTFQSDIET